MESNIFEAMEIDKNNIELLYKKADIYAIYSSQTEKIFKEYYEQQSLNVFNFIITNFSSNKEYLQKIYFEKGLIYQYKKNYTAAIDNFTKAAKLSNNILLLSKCYYSIGSSYVATGKYKKALSNFEKFQSILNVHTLEIDYDSKYYRFSDGYIGLCFFKTKKYKEAIYYLDKYINNVDEKDPASIKSESHYWRGLTYHNIGKDDLALKDLYVALNLTEDDKLKETINKLIADIRRRINKHKKLHYIDRRVISGNDVRMYLSMNQNYIHIIFPETRAFEGKGFRFEYGDWQTKLIATDKWTGDMLYELWATDEVIKECGDSISVAKAYYS